MIFGILAVAILAVLNATPLAFFSMLFFGNIGWNLGFMDLLPGAIAVGVVKNSNLFTVTMKKEK